MTDRKISPRQSSAVLQAFSNGVTPRIGLEHVVVGRKAETEAMLDDLDYRVQSGGASFRLLVGPYGSGKSFMLQVIRNYALQRNFVVADADLSAERRLTGTKGQGLGLYRELLKNMAIRTRPEGGAFAPLLEHWMNSIQEETMRSANLLPDDPRFTLLLNEKVQETLSSISALSNSFDFARVLLHYWRAYQAGDEVKMEHAIRWLRGEYQVKSEVFADLQVRSMVTDKDWYNYLKLFAAFFQLIGYKGLIVFFDEAVNLYKISNAVSRNNNYEQLLTLFNDVNQGVAQHIGLIFSGTPQLVEDTKRGLYSYEALRSRLQESRFSQNGRRSFAGPIIRLDTLTNEELFVLLQKLRHIHALHYKYETTITDNDIQQFMEVVTAQIGSAQYLTPREVTRDFIAVMEMMRRDETLTFTGIVHKQEFVASRQQTNPEELTAQTEIIDDDSAFASFTL
ncbi:biotin carboxylase [Ktedonobacter sp. SOSP1-52]|uniref:ATP-binding protein n=1 Tax=Ktedonobacter sp. SOSP1-52 TaxID=2778366 RepID=UPI001915D8B6|nr:ATP-binding protein [Ktedonobacter sp. SOSP1-52]GHO65062.1 biotin carboxylase [Ktedonobacter sp. SOSP1-52]